MNKNYIILFLILVIFISGCKQATDKTEGPFKGGNSGVDISFVEGTPPSNFNQDQTVPVKVSVKNNGEHDLATGVVKAKLFGVILDNFGLTSSYKAAEGNLRGISEFITEGAEREINLGNMHYNLDVVNFKTFNLRAQVCYPYQTKSHITTCVSSTQIKETGKEICSTEGEKVTKGSVSSAPVQITSLKEQVRGSDQIVYDITIENKGNGIIYDTTITCEQLEDAVQRGTAQSIVKLEVLPADIRCGFLEGEGNKGEVKLISNKKTLSCIQTIKDTTSSAEQDISITLDYMYVSDTSKEIKIFETV